MSNNNETGFKNILKDFQGNCSKTSAMAGNKVNTTSPPDVRILEMMDLNIGDTRVHIFFLFSIVHILKLVLLG